MELSWSKTNEKKAIIFTDEFLQSSYLDPILTTTESCIFNDYSINIFLDSNTPDYNLWQEITQNCGGFIEEINLNDEDLLGEKLNYYFGKEC